jgi:diketogulonate reductase-like aldo/keto reductase
MQNQIETTTTTSAEMPKIIYGTAWKKERTAELVIQAVKAGFGGIDTACQPKHYAEPLVGTALMAPKSSGIKREQLFIQTKFTSLSGQDLNTVPYDKNASLPMQVEQSFEASKTNLDTKYIDSLLLHSPLSNFSDTLSVWRAMETVYKRGEALRLGISNCYDLKALQRLYSEAEVKPAVVQNRFYNDSGYDAALRAWCKNHNIIYQSFWSLTANPHILKNKELITLAIKYQKSEAQIFFAYLISQEIVPLSGTTSLEHMLQDLEATSLTLTLDEISSISSLLF